MGGIKKILITGRPFNKSIPIGAGTVMAGIMTGVFTISTIVATGKVGIKVSRAAVLLALLVMGIINLKNLLVVMKGTISSPPSGASFQIAPPGRSGNYPVKVPLSLTCNPSGRMVIIKKNH
jgi:hypothetical protein